MPFDASRYPDNWQTISLRIREREGWQCKFCGAKQGEPHPITGSKVILTVAHLGVPYPDGRPGNPHDKMDVRDENLAALCQRCHLNYDRAEHLLNAAYTRWQKKVKAGQLFFITYDDPRTTGVTMSPQPILPPDPDALRQLVELEQIIANYLALFPSNPGSCLPPFAQFSPALRRGIVYMRRGHGWKLTQNWRSVLAEKRQALTGEFSQGDPQ